MTEPIELDLRSGRPPTGRISIEASAGTGKTYSLTQLVVLHVVHGTVAADQVLLVTFTRAATAELRHKTREMCSRALEALDSGDTAGLDWLASIVSDPSLRQEARTRLAAFLSRYDEVTISTIHGFCQRILRKAGLSGAVPPGFEVAAGIDEVVDRVVTDALASPLAADPRAFVRADDGSRPVATPDAADIAKGTVSKMRKSVLAALRNPGAVILPFPPGKPRALPPGKATSPARQTSTVLAETIASTVTTLVCRIRKWSLDHGIVTHDDLVRLAAAAVAPGSSDTSETPDEPGVIDAISKPAAMRHTALAAELAAQYRLIMVDEFQDTDALQWQIFSAIHEADSQNHTLVTVGDAKQAIYRFRGADVAVYVDAESKVQSRYRISTNRRSTRRLLAALETLFMRRDPEPGEGFAFDEAGSVRFLPVAHDPVRDTDLAIDRDGVADIAVTDAPLEIRWIAHDDELAEGRDVNLTKLVQDVINADFPNRIVEMLRHGSIPVRDSTSGRGVAGRRAVLPEDIAVLVTSHKQADEAVIALRAVGVPVVQMKTGSVAASDAATQWRMFLSGVAYPQRPRRVRANAVSVFGTMDVAALLVATDDELAEAQRSCSDDAVVLATRGVTALYLSHRMRPAFLQRVLAREDGERLLTDLDHIAELLASHPSLSRRPSPLEVLATLEEMVDNADDEDQGDERKRRIETDSSAVTVMTIHASKGLQFPVVVLPNLHTMAARSESPYLFTHDLGNGRRRIIDPSSGFGDGGCPDRWEYAPEGVLDPVIGVKSQTRAKVKVGREVLQKREAHDERRRLLYVALTRAEYKVITYWSRVFGNYPTGDGTLKVPWAELLEWSAPAVTKGHKLEDGHVAATMRALSSSPGGEIATVKIGPNREQFLRWEAPPTGVGGSVSALGHATIEVSSFVASGWRRWSYSGLSRLFKQGFAGAEMRREPRSAHGLDERNESIPPARLDDDISTQPVDGGLTSLGRVRGGAALGDLVHSVMDTIDPSSATVEADISSCVGTQLAGWATSAATPEVADAITRGIVETLDCPLGQGFGDETLRTLGRRHRLSEMHFDFRLGQSSPFPLTAIGEILGREPGLPAELARYAGRIADSIFASHDVAGFMTGSIDAVLRAGTGDATRFFIVDYKTDTVHQPGDVEKWRAYEGPRLDAFMADRGYVIQALVYSVAMHRFLRWRLGDDYDFERHFGGVAYLFMRGMTGEMAGDGNPRGVWRWRPSSTLVGSLDALFSADGGLE